jgi:hypothetical protein
MKKGKRRWLLLRGGSLLWYEGAPQSGKSELRGTLPLAGCTVDAVPVRPHHARSVFCVDDRGVQPMQFKVTSSSEQEFVFALAAASDADAWLKALKAAVASQSREHEIALLLARKNLAELTGKRTCGRVVRATRRRDVAMFGLSNAPFVRDQLDPAFDMLNFVLVGDDTAGARAVCCKALRTCRVQRHVVLHCCSRVPMEGTWCVSGRVRVAGLMRWQALLHDLVMRELDRSISVGTLFRTDRCAESN